MTDGERSILRQALRCGFLGNSQQRARKSPGGPLGGRAPLSGVSVGEEPLSWVHRRPWLRRETGLEKPQGTGKRGGSWPGALGTRNVRPQRPSTWDEDLVPGQCQLEETGLGHLALLITLGATVPPRRLKFGCFNLSAKLYRSFALCPGVGDFLFSCESQVYRNFMY